jgi:hypothetical protein
MPRFVLAVREFALSDFARVVLAVVLLVGTLAIVLAGREVPAALWAFDGSAVTFYYLTAAAKSGQ